MTLKERKLLLDDIDLIRRGVRLAEQRERHPSYVMELQAVLQVVDELRDDVAGAEVDGEHKE
jgi:predicted transcriptional regulator